MNILTPNLWKNNSNPIPDPFLSLSNPNLSSKYSADRFLSHHPQTSLSQSSQPPNPHSNALENIKYEQALFNTCKTEKKKKCSQKSFMTKIKNYGYLLNSDIVSNEQETARKIPSEPYRVVHAPKLKDDFYTNLLDWSSDDIISVVLNNAVYVWSNTKNQTQKLVQGYVSCVKWGKGLLLGEETGRLRVIDNEKKCEVVKWRNHEGRVGTIDVHHNKNLVISGSKDKSLLLWDLRAREMVTRLEGHRQEICGLKFSPDGNYIASGGNDNLVCLWNFRMQKLENKLNEHSAAVKALAWSPHQNSMLVTGGGSTDKTIKIWNINENCCMKSIDTGSQVCTIAYSKNTDEIISTHGFSLNSVNVWNAKNMKKVATLQGHTYRVLYMAKSPEEDSIVTGSGDQTLRFWKIWSGIDRRRQVSQLEAKNSFIR